ncbi:MAG: DUF5718 family protein [Leptospirales bacterium]
MQISNQIGSMIGLGVAGNFAGHLEQAGEADSFAHVKVKEAIAPKAIFPFYVHEHAGFLSTFPLSGDTITFPNEGDNLQIEPEVALICRITYKKSEVKNEVVDLTPLQFAAYNDCSIRNPNARKISQKKNWGEKTKGVSKTFLDIDKFTEGGIMDKYRIACFLHRGADFIEYGIDSPVKGYSYFHAKLLDWIVEKMNSQQDEDPMENIADHLKTAGYPKYALISIGATRYTEFGETHFLQKGDRSVVVAYDGTLYTPDEITERVKQNNLNEKGISALCQDIV